MGSEEVATPCLRTAPMALALGTVTMAKRSRVEGSYFLTLCAILALGVGVGSARRTSRES